MLVCGIRAARILHQAYWVSTQQAQAHVLIERRHKEVQVLLCKITAAHATTKTNNRAGRGGLGRGWGGQQSSCVVWMKPHLRYTTLTDTHTLSSVISTITVTFYTQSREGNTG